MTEICGCCGAYILDCDCETYDVMYQTKNAFYNFLLDGIEHFAPDVFQKLEYHEAVRFTEYWVKNNFEEEDHSED